MGQVSSPPRYRAAGSESEVSGPRPPKVSLCIPAFQAERYLQATIDSVLAQTYADLEVVIVDNCSSDGTSDIVANVDDDRVRVIRNPTTLPMVDNFNLAVRQCRGEFVKLVCADDLLEPDCVATQTAVLENIPGVALVSGRTDFIDEDGRLLVGGRGLRGILGRHSAQRVVRKIVRSGGNPIGAPVCAMFRRSDFERTGGFRAESVFMMDMDLWVRLLRNGDFFGVPRTLASFRISGGSTTGTTSPLSQLAQQAEFVRRLLDDGQWSLSSVDRVVARVKLYDGMLKRTLLFAMSNHRARRRRSAGST